MNASTAKYRCYGERTGRAGPRATPYHYLNAQTVNGGKQGTTHIARKGEKNTRWYLEVRVPAIGTMCAAHWRCVASMHTSDGKWQNYCQEEI